MLSTKPISSTTEDLFERKEFVNRLVDIVLANDSDTKLIGMYARWGSGKTSTLNLCREASGEEKYKDSNNYIKSHWVFPFETWQMESMGDLRVSLLWHLRKQLPQELINNESILYRMGRVGVALSIVGLNTAGKLLGAGNFGTDAIKGLETADVVLPLGDSVVSSESFAQAEQSSKVTEAFDALGEAICDALGVNKIVIPIDDMDRCKPELAVSLLFSLKNLLRSDRFRFVVAIDRHAMVRFLTLNYGEQFSLEDANWFLEKIFDDWVDIPPPPLDKLYGQIKFPDNISDVQSQKFMEFLASSGLSMFAGNPRRFMRGCQRFERFVAAKYSTTQNESPCSSRLFCNFSWCVLYGAFPEQFDSILSARGFGRIGSEYETVITVCDSIRKISTIHSDEKEAKITTYLNDILNMVSRAGISVMGVKVDGRKTKSDVASTRVELLSLLPSDLREYAEDYNSAMMQFIRIMSQNQTPEKLSSSLKEVLPFL